MFNARDKISNQANKSKNLVKMNTTNNDVLGKIVIFSVFKKNDCQKNYCKYILLMLYKAFHFISIITIDKHVNQVKLRDLLKSNK